jgi:amphi-Trp domain-containing protein
MIDDTQNPTTAPAAATEAGAEAKPQKSKPRKEEVNLKAVVDLNQAVAHAQDLVDSIKKGNILVEQGTEVMTLTPPDQVKLKVKAVRKGSKEKLKLEISWNTAQANNGNADFKIKST